MEGYNYIHDFNLVYDLYYCARSRSSVIVSVQNCTGAPPADKTPDISPLPFSPPFHCEKRRNAPEKNSLRQRGDTGGEERCVNILVERTSKGGRTEENEICVPVMAPHLLRRYLQCQFFCGRGFHDQSASMSCPHSKIGEVSLLWLAEGEHLMVLDWWVLKGRRIGAAFTVCARGVALIQMEP